MSVQVMHVNLPIGHGQTDEVVAFYVDVFGFAEAPRPETGRTGAWIDIGDGTQIHLSERDGAAHPDQHVALRVDDYAGVQARAAAARAPWTDRGDERAVLRDPAGNLIEVFGPGASLA